MAILIAMMVSGEFGALATAFHEGWQYRRVGAMMAAATLNAQGQIITIRLLPCSDTESRSGCRSYMGRSSRMLGPGGSRWLFSCHCFYTGMKEGLLMTRASHFGPLSGYLCWLFTFWRRPGVWCFANMVYGVWWFFVLRNLLSIFIR